MRVSADMPILIVDDYKTTLRIMRTLLKQIGFHNVEEAMTADEAYTLACQKDYGLILCDWNMEPKSGYDLLQNVRRDASLKTPFVMIVPKNGEDKVSDAIAAGATGHITKPFKASALKNTLTEALGQF